MKTHRTVFEEEIEPAENSATETNKIIRLSEFRNEFEGMEVSAEDSDSLHDIEHDIFSLGQEQERIPSLLASLHEEKDIREKLWRSVKCLLPITVGLLATLCALMVGLLFKISNI